MNDESNFRTKVKADDVGVDLYVRSLYQQKPNRSVEFFFWSTFEDKTLTVVAKVTN